MVYPLSYRRPERAPRPDTPSSITSETKQKSIHESVRSSSSGMSNGIPEALSFDTIIAGGACPVSYHATFYITCPFQQLVTRHPSAALYNVWPKRSC